MVLTLRRWCSSKQLIGLNVLKKYWVEIRKGGPCRVTTL